MPSLQRKTFPADKPLLRLGHKSQVVYFLLEGRVKICIPQPSGGGCLVNLCGPGAVLGEVSVLDGAGHSADVTTIETCRFLWMHQADFCKYLHTLPELAYALMQQMARRLRHNCLQMQTITRLNVNSRLACLLLNFTQSHENAGSEQRANESIAGESSGDAFHPGDTNVVHGGSGMVARLPLRLRQRDLAATIGSTRQSVNKALSEFKGKGWIEIDPEQRIVILNRSALTALCYQ